MDLLKIKTVSLRASVLIILRNLVSVKENKMHFLTEENCLVQISHIMLAKSPRLLALSTSFVWVLLYDCEKAKVILRRTKLWDAIMGLEMELQSLSEEGTFLKEARENLLVIKKLLNI